MATSNELGFQNDYKSFWTSSLPFRLLSDLQLSESDASESEQPRTEQIVPSLPDSPVNLKSNGSLGLTPRRAAALISVKETLASIPAKPLLCSPLPPEPHSPVANKSTKYSKTSVNSSRSVVYAFFQVVDNFRLCPLSSLFASIFVNYLQNLLDCFLHMQLNICHVLSFCLVWFCAVKYS